ncbi:MAG: DUF2064 domain-containing protein [Gammaproteobacteria bacterium]
MQTRTCLVLMFKSPDRSKQRLTAEIGARARTAAEHLLACALADLAAWPGPTCLAPAQSRDMRFISAGDRHADICASQGSGNLGERIETVNATLLEAGYEQQIFIGIDCPALDTDYYSRADSSLQQANVVLGPAEDGGVVLMGVRGRWPALAGLPWSTAALKSELMRSCKRAALRIAMLEPHNDVDRACDLRALSDRLADDQRPSRQRLREWINSESLV